MRTGKWILILVMAAPAYAQNNGRLPLYQRNLAEPADPGAPTVAAASISEQRGRGRRA